MFDAVRNNPKIVQVFLGLITLPFAFFGMEAYFSNSGPGGNSAAKVGSVEISSIQLEEAVRDQENLLREQMGGVFDRSFVDTPEFKAAVLDRLINEAAVKAGVRDSKLIVSAEAIQAYIKSQSEFQENGQFSKALYEAGVRARGLTPVGFEQRVREGLAQQMLMLPVAYSNFSATQSARRLLELESEERTVSELVFDAAQYAGRVTLDDEAVRKYYDANQARFQTPEQVKFEYVMLSLDDLSRQVKVSDEDARKWYDENLKVFQASEERRASHILVQLAPDAKPDAKAAARKKAEDLLAKVTAAPGKFGELAKANSDDSGSAEKGGDLGFFARGTMVKPFEDAAFSLKPGDVSGLVESEFGYHIIKLTDSKGGKAKSFEEVKTEALAAVRKQQADQRFSELADQFSNLVYEQPDALKPVAEKFSLPLIQTDWVAREALPPVLRNQKFQAALFSSDSLQNRRNTEAVDLGNGMVVAARVLEHKPVAIRPFEEVKPMALELAKAEEAARLAQNEGEAFLKKLQSGESVSANWKAAKVLKRSSGELNSALRTALFAASAEKLPVFVGGERNSAYAIYRVEKVAFPPSLNDEAAVNQMRKQYAMVLGQEDLRAFIAGMRERQGVQIKASEK